MQQQLKNKQIYLSTCLFIISIVLIIWGKYYHEPWRDELHSLCISVAAKDPFQLYYFRRYEGHPYIYYLILFLTQIGGKNYFSFLAIHFLASVIVFYLLYFKFNLPNYIKILLPFNYYLLFEFGIINRHYIFVLLFLLLAIYFYKKSESNLIVSLLFIAIAANTHVQAIAICICLAACIIYEQFLLNSISKKKAILLFTLAGFLICLSYLSCIPPDDCYNKLHRFLPNSYNLYGTIAKINFGTNTIFNTSIFDFWNNQKTYSEYIQYIFFIFFILGSSFAINKKYRFFYVGSFFIIFYMLLLLTTWGIRHYSFLWISFFIFYILGYSTQNKLASAFLFIYLLVQAITGTIAFTKEYKFVFSDCKSTANSLENLSKRSSIPIAGYCNYMLDGLTFFTKKPIYYLGAQSFETYTEYNNSDFGFRDLPKFEKLLHSYLNKNNNTFFVISNGDSTKLYRYSIEKDTTFNCQKVYFSPQKSIVEDEVYVIYHLKQKL